MVGWVVVGARRVRTEEQARHPQRSWDRHEDASHQPELMVIPRLSSSLRALGPPVVQHARLIHLHLHHPKRRLRTRALLAQSEGWQPFRVTCAAAPPPTPRVCTLLNSSLRSPKEL